MKDTTKHTGTLMYLRREKNSFYGNPRYLLMLDGMVCLTKPDSCEAYGVSNYFGKEVQADIGLYRGNRHIENIEPLEMKE